MTTIVVRLDEDDKEWSPDKADYVPRTNIHIFDGVDDKRLFKGGATGFTCAFIGGNIRRRLRKANMVVPGDDDISTI